MNESTFENAAKQTLFYRRWQPTGRVRATLAIVPGFNSHSGYYGWVAEQLERCGMASYALDLRGRGRSGGERFYVDDFEEYVSDLADFVSLIQEQSMAPLYLLGHSAGGVVAALYAAETQVKLAGLICESFAFRVPAPDFALSLLKGVSHVAPHAHVLKLKNGEFSRDLQAVSAMNRDPLIAEESQPSKTVAAMVRADERLERAFPNITLPLFILHGTADRATKPSGSQLFFEMAGARDKTLKLYEGYYHDPLNDVGKSVVMTDILNWLETRTSKGASAQPNTTLALP